MLGCVDNFSISHFLLIIIQSGLWARLGDPCLYQCPIGIHECRYYYYYYYYYCRFSHQRKLMVFHWRLCPSKSLWVSQTLLSILAVFNNAAVWMVSTRPQTSKSSRPFKNPLVTVPKPPITIGKISPSCPIVFFSILLQDLGSYLSFHILSVLFCGQLGQQCPQFCRFSFFVDHYKIRSSDRD